MPIEYKRIDSAILAKLAETEGDWLNTAVIIREDTFPLAALDGGVPVGYICCTARVLDPPLEHLQDAYIEVLGVDEHYRRQGIGEGLVARAEEWAKSAGFRQIRTHSNNRAVEAIHLWLKRGYGLCQHDYHEYDPATEEYKNRFSGYWVAKVL